MAMIKFMHDDSESWSIVRRDCRIFRAWEEGDLDEIDASERMALNNGLDQISVEDFLESAEALGYRRRGK